MYYDISHHTRLVPKKESLFGKVKAVLKPKAKVSKEDRKYLSWLQLQGFSCIVCESYDVEMHHVKRDSTDKKNHKRLIPLCKEHHTMSAEFSVHGTPKKFRETYPMEFQYKLADKIYKEYKNV